MTSISKNNSSVPLNRYGKLYPYDKSVVVRGYWKIHETNAQCRVLTNQAYISILDRKNFPKVVQIKDPPPYLLDECFENSVRDTEFEGLVYFFDTELSNSFELGIMFENENDRIKYILSSEYR